MVDMLFRLLYAKTICRLFLYSAQLQFVCLFRTLYFFSYYFSVSTSFNGYDGYPL